MAYFQSNDDRDDRRKLPQGEAAIELRESVTSSVREIEFGEVYIARNQPELYSKLVEWRRAGKISEFMFDDATQHPILLRVVLSIGDSEVAYPWLERTEYDFIEPNKAKEAHSQYNELVMTTLRRYAALDAEARTLEFGTIPPDCERDVSIILSAIDQGKWPPVSAAALLGDPTEYRNLKRLMARQSLEADWQAGQGGKGADNK